MQAVSRVRTRYDRCPARTAHPDWDSPADRSSPLISHLNVTKRKRLNLLSSMDSSRLAEVTPEKRGDRYICLEQ